MNPQQIELLNGDDAPKSGTIQANLDWLNASITVEDHTLYSVAQVAVVLDRDVDKLRVFTGSLKKWSELDPNVWAFSFKVNGVGQDFADAGIQGMIDYLAAQDAWPDDVRGKIKAIGVVTRPRWKTSEDAVQPTSDDVKAVLFKRRVADSLSGILQQINDGSLTDFGPVSDAVSSGLSQASAAMGV